MYTYTTKGGGGGDGIELIRTPSFQPNCITAIIQVTEGRMLVSPAVEDLCSKNKHHTITFKVHSTRMYNDATDVWHVSYIERYVTMPDSSFRSIRNPVCLYALLRCQQTYYWVVNYRHKRFRNTAFSRSQYGSEVKRALKHTIFIERTHLYKKYCI